MRLKSEDLRRYSCNVSFVGTWRLLRPKEDSLPIFEGMIKKAMDYPNTPIKGLFDRLLRWKSGTEVNFSSIEKILWIIEDEAMTRYRGDILLSLSRFGVNLYGNPEMRDLETRGIRYCGWVDNRRELPKVYNATKINIALSISLLKDALNISVFNILASGGFMITNTRSDLLRLFRKDEVVCFEDKMDLIGKVDYYLKNPKEREEIALQGQRRVLKEHTFLHRMKEVLSVMGDFIN
jgi:spore maturation protein CgeB